ncbi:MAG: adenine deaminase [Bacteroidetes bacterium]|nr:MAG: adenine deaminase [Bacteroidota bacterium]
MSTITGKLVDIHQKKIYAAEISVENGKIKSIKENPTGIPPIENSVSSTGEAGAAVPPPLGELEGAYILPGFIDAHVHIESSMLVPSEFARLAVIHGTVATVSDPHEIANVCGIEGVEFMIRNGKTVPFKFHFGAPSCVPATRFETAGASLDSDAVRKLLQSDDIYYLSEMMNFPGVLNEDEEVMKKIAAAHHLLKPVDGHAPGLRGDDAKKYIAAGITTDHECFSKEEALDKLQNGMKIIIREGSAAKNFEALIDLLHEYPNQMMFCSDDKHPDSLVEGHINQLCSRAVARGIDLFKVLRAACVNPVHHYKMKVGLLREGDAADLIVVNDLKNFGVLQTYINGELVAENGKSIPESFRYKGQGRKLINNFSCNKKNIKDFEVKGISDQGKSISNSRWSDDKNTLQAIAIEALDGQLITNKTSFKPVLEKGSVMSDTDQDILKIVVVNRYKDAPVAKAFIKNFGLKAGALASSVAHDSHNIVAVGVDDENICEAVNMVIEHKGGVSFVSDDTQMIVPLPVAGLMSDADGYKVAEQYSLIDKAAKYAGCTLSAPFMTLSFMALLVIPHLKLSDLGLFDGDKFELVN